MEDLVEQEPAPDKPGPRPVLQCYCDEDTARNVKVAAAKEDLSVSDWVRNAVLEALEQREEEEERGPVDKSLAARKRYFFEMLERHYHLSEAAKRADIEIRQLAKWTQEPKMREQIAFHQAIFLERTERKMLAIGQGSGKKGNWQALVAFLNAHHPQYGIKAEILARISGDLVERFGTAVKKILNEQQANQVITLLQQHANKKTLQFK